jgi:hypothetical protein
MNPMQAYIQTHNFVHVSSILGNIHFLCVYVCTRVFKYTLYVCHRRIYLLPFNSTRTCTFVHSAFDTNKNKNKRPYLRVRRACAHTFNSIHFHMHACTHTCIHIRRVTCIRTYILGWMQYKKGINTNYLLSITQCTQV